MEPGASRWLIAKTDREDPEKWLPLWLHLADTANIMGLLAARWLPTATQRFLARELADREPGPLCVFLGAAHDEGKATAVFQSCVVDRVDGARERLEERGLAVPGLSAFLSRGKTPHALAGEVILQQLGCAAGTASVVGAHHGKPQGIQWSPEVQLGPAGYTQNYYGGRGRELWEACWRELLEQALSMSGAASLTELPTPSMPAQVLLTGLLIMADWLASNTEYFPLLDSGDWGRGVDPDKRALEAWERISLPEPWASTCFSVDGAAFFARFGFYPRPVQQAVLEAVDEADCPGLFILEAQMGVGKTEAALAAAEALAGRLGAGGLYFGLPTQATANGIFGRLQAWAQEQSQDTVHSVRLAHGMTELNEDYRQIFRGSAALAEDAQEGLVVHPWFEGRKQALLADFVIGTIDQLLMAALKQKHVMLRHLGLAGKVVIIDECHAYDAYMSQYLDMALTWLGAYGTPVIVLSATLPAQRRARLVEAYVNDKGLASAVEWRESRAYPLLTWTDGKTVMQKQLPDNAPPRVVAIQRRTDGELPELLRESLSDGGCAAVICNTVRRAQALAQILEGELPGAEIVVFHAQFLYPDRARREKTLLERLGKHSGPAQRNGLLVIGTQVLEQSLDIDLDLLVTDLCPMDLLLQRIGRLHRHDRPRPERMAEARCVVLGTEGELEPGSRSVYGAWLLLRTRALLPDRVTLPRDIPKLVQETYDRQPPAPDAPEQLLRAWEERELQQAKSERSARAYRVGKPVRSVFPQKNTLDGWLETTVGASDADARAAVRDGDAGIEVLVLSRRGDGSIGLLPWMDGAEPLSADHVPSEAACRRIAGQRLRLPGVFCADWLRGKAIARLEEMQRGLAEWRQSRWLCGELILLLDEALEAELCGYRLRYSQEIGLQYDKEEGNAGKDV